MKSRRTRKFKNLFNKLPEQIKDNARKQYELFVKNPSHPSLRTKLIGSTRNEKLKVFEVTVGMGYRATYFIDKNISVWVWIGTHNSFDKRY
ncbi:hypothetical protein KJ640_02055 [bacterium]|nr:hypothetical protein [bacterium]